MKKKLNKRKVLAFILLIINLILISVLIFFTYTHLDMNKRKRDSYVSSYSENSNITYTIHMIENDYITNENFGKSNSYILKYTDYILFNFSYNYTSSQNLDTYAHYEIIANISGNYKKSTNDISEIYNKNFLLDSGDINSNSNNIYIEKNTKINLNEYNNILKKLQEDLKLPLTGVLTVYLNVDTKDSYGNIIDNYKSPVTITLLKDIYEVEITKEEPRVRNFYNDNLEINYIYLVGLSSGIIILVTFSMILIKFILQKKMTKGQIEATKYLRTYDDFIVNIDDMINESKYQVVKIKEFKELLTLANNNSTSILYFNQKKKGLFYVLLDNYLYKFEIDYRS